MREKTNVVKLEFMMYGNTGTDIQRDILDKIASQVDWLKENAAIFSLKMRPDSLCYETKFQEFGDFYKQSETWVDIFRDHIFLLQDLKKDCNLEYALVYAIEFYGNLLPGFSLSDSLIQFADQIRLSSIDFDIYYHVLSSDTEILPPRGPRWIFRQVDLETRLYERNNGPNKINLLLEVIGEGAEEICSTGFQSSVFKRGDLNPYRKNTSSSDEIAWFYEVGFQESDDIGEAFAELLLVFGNQTDRLRQ
ncbi:MAG: hypothetical protein Q4A78_10445 [Peptostreptococcaceae bacterium]|nr:hypothetical protein [Peptostreptococcaceae bacterium]